MKRRVIVLAALLGVYTASAQHRILVGGCGYGEVAVFDKDGAKEWSIAEKNEVSDAWLLKNQNIAFAYKHGVKIVKPDWSTKNGYETVFNRPAPKDSETHTFQPLPDGGFLIGESHNGFSYIIELDENFKERKRLEIKKIGGAHTTFRQIRKTPQNTYLITQQKKNGQAMEINTNGEIIKKFPSGRYVAERLENGNTLISCGDEHRVFEVDKNNNIVWDLKQNDLDGITIGFAAGVQRLPNGNTLICNWGGHNKDKSAKSSALIEVSPDKKVVWSSSPGKKQMISTVQVLK